MKKETEELKAKKEKIIKELINEINIVYKDCTKEERLEKLMFIWSHRKELLEMDEIYKCREKNFKELKKRIPNNTMSFLDLNDLLKDNGYYSMNDFTITKRKANKYKILYKAADKYHHDLLVTFIEVDWEGDALDIIVIDFQKVSKEKFKEMYDNKKILD